jgi:DNA polymerase-3 subunit epsilon
VSSLSQLEVLVVDCQATAARGHLLELGWARVGAAGVVNPSARLVKLPLGQHVPPAVVRVTGIDDRLLWDAVEPWVAWRELVGQAALLSFQPAPTVVHFARFEQPFLESLAGGPAPLELICTHELARRLFPELPRRSLRALAGYFGHAVGSLRRAGEHVEATAFVWRELVKLLGQRGVETWPDVRAFLSAPVAKARGKKVWPMPRAVRLALPDAPGLYRMLRTSGDVLYVGKASSLHARVNSYFRKQHGIHERTLEMLSQARDLSFVVTQSPLEAALLEPDEIKLHHPPYNVALTEAERAVWFATTDLSSWTTRADEKHSVGPFPSTDPLIQLAALSRGDGAALGNGRWAPPPEIFGAAFARLRLVHPELRAGTSNGQLLRLGTRLWREGRRDREEDEAPTWTPELAFTALEWLTIRVALARRRARWFTRLAESTLLWTERGGARLLKIEGGQLSVRDPDGLAPVPAHHVRPALQRHASLTLAVFDRLRVLTTELKRLVDEKGASATLRLGPDAVFDTAQLSRALAWV